MRLTRSRKTAPFRFLDLSPEIRNIIYAFVFAGDNTIHVNSDQTAGRTSITHSICCARQPDNSVATAYRAATEDKEVPCYARRHRRCVWRGGDRNPTNLDLKLDLSILLVCRQVYQEAVLMPFAANTFAFDSVPAMSDLLLYLTKEQGQSIGSITLSCDVSNVPTTLVTKLKGLKSLTVFHEFDFNYDNALDFPLLDGAQGKGHKARDAWLGGLFKFERLPLEKVTCCFYSGHQQAAAIALYNVLRYPTLMPGMFNPISKIVEERLLREWTGGKKSRRRELWRTSTLYLEKCAEDEQA